MKASARQFPVKVVEGLVDDLEWAVGFITPETRDEYMTQGERNRLTAALVNLEKARRLVRQRAT
jgi:hypothetical protein